jgi:hypothetical protein
VLLTPFVQVASGVPVFREDHADALVYCALVMVEVAKQARYAVRRAFFVLILCLVG